MKNKPNQLDKRHNRNPRNSLKTATSAVPYKPPLKGKKLFLDLKSYRGVVNLENELKLLGAIIAECFSKEVHLLVTNTGKPQDYERHRKGDAASAASPSHQINLSGEQGAEALQTTPFQVKKAFTRGRALANAASLAKSYGSADVITNAKKWNIRIAHLESVKKFIRREIEKIPASQKGAPKSTPPVKFKETKVAKLKEPYIKFETLNQCYKPVRTEFESFPEVHFDTPFGACPFDKHKARGQKDKNTNHGQEKAEVEERDPVQDREGHGESLQESGRESKNVTEKTKEGLTRPRKGKKGCESGKPACHMAMTAGDLRRIVKEKKLAEKKRGYCELCEVRYDNIDKHVRSSQHKDYVRNQDNYKSLDTMIEEGPNMTRFLNDVMQYQKLHKSEGLESESKRDATKSDEKQNKIEEKPKSTKCVENISPTKKKKETASQDKQSSVAHKNLSTSTSPKVRSSPATRLRQTKTLLKSPQKQTKKIELDLEKSSVKSPSKNIQSHTKCAKSPSKFMKSPTKNQDNIEQTNAPRTRNRGLAKEVDVQSKQQKIKDEAETALDENNILSDEHRIEKDEEKEALQKDKPRNKKRSLRSAVTEPCQDREKEILISPRKSTRSLRKSTLGEDGQQIVKCDKNTTISPKKNCKKLTQDPAPLKREVTTAHRALKTTEETAKCESKGEIDLINNVSVEGDGKRTRSEMNDSGEKECADTPKRKRRKRNADSVTSLQIKELKKERSPRKTRRSLRLDDPVEEKAKEIENSSKEKGAEETDPAGRSNKQIKNDIQHNENNVSGMSSRKSFNEIEEDMCIQKNANVTVSPQDLKCKEKASKKKKTKKIKLKQNWSVLSDRSMQKLFLSDTISEENFEGFTDDVKIELPHDVSYIDRSHIEVEENSDYEWVLDEEDDPGSIVSPIKTPEKTTSPPGVDVKKDTKTTPKKKEVPDKSPPVAVQPRRSPRKKVQSQKYFSIEEMFASDNFEQLWVGPPPDKKNKSLNSSCDMNSSTVSSVNNTLTKTPIYHKKSKLSLPKNKGRVSQQSSPALAGKDFTRALNSSENKPALGPIHSTPIVPNAQNCCNVTPTSTGNIQKSLRSKDKDSMTPTGVMSSSRLKKKEGATSMVADTGKENIMRHKTRREDPPDVMSKEKQTVILKEDKIVKKGSLSSVSMIESVSEHTSLPDDIVSISLTEGVVMSIFDRVKCRKRAAGSNASMSLTSASRSSANKKRKRDLDEMSNASSGSTGWSTVSTQGTKKVDNEVEFNFESPNKGTVKKSNRLKTETKNHSNISNSNSETKSSHDIGSVAKKDVEIPVEKKSSPNVRKPSSQKKLLSGSFSRAQKTYNLDHIPGFKRMKQHRLGDKYRSKSFGLTSGIRQSPRKSVQNKTIGYFSEKSPGKSRTLASASGLSSPTSPIKRKTSPRKLAFGSSPKLKEKLSGNRNSKTGKQMVTINKDSFSSNSSKDRTRQDIKQARKKMLSPRSRERSPRINISPLDKRRRQAQNPNPSSPRRKLNMSQTTPAAARRFSPRKHKMVSPTLQKLGTIRQQVKKLGYGDLVSDGSDPYQYGDI